VNYHEVGSIQKTNYRKSGLLLAGIVAALELASIMRGRHQLFLSVVAVFLVIMAAFEMRPLRIIIDLLIKFGNFMHRFTNPLVFGLIYIVAVLPTYLALKLAGKDILQLRHDKNTNSYWQVLDNGKKWKESFRKQY